MSSILIKVMEMPKSCRACPLKMNCDDCEGWECVCVPLHKRIGYFDDLLTDKRRDDCPLVEIPPHGDLIDRDALMARFEKEEKAADEHGRDFSFSFKSAGENCAEWWSVQQMLFDAPTIIEAEEGHE